MEFFYKILYFIIQCSVLFIITARDYVLLIYWFLKQLYLDGLSRVQPHDALSRTKIQLSHFEKLPSHIGIIINEEVVCFQQLANIIVWCLALGVPHISIYDIDGLVKSNGFNLYKNTMKCKERYLKKSSSKYKVTFHGAESDELSNGTKNGHIYENELDVTLLSWEDGKRDIVDAASVICNDVKNKVLSLNDVNRTQFSKYLKALPRSPDPDLVFCFGRGSSLVGYLPWQVHLSEIMFERSHRYFRLSRLLAALEKYNSCQQRFGK